MAKKGDKLQDMKDKLQEAKAKVIELEQNFEKKVGEHPWQSLAVAFGVGFISGAVIFALGKRK